MHFFLNDVEWYDHKHDLFSNDVECYDEKHDFLFNDVECHDVQHHLFEIFDESPASSIQNIH